MAFGVYAIIFPAVHAIYIGSTIADIHTRFRVHRKALSAGKHDNVEMQRLFSSGEKAEFVVLEECDDKDKVRELEQYYIDTYTRDGWKICNEIPALLDGNYLPTAAREKIKQGVRDKNKKKKGSWWVETGSHNAKLDEVMAQRAARANVQRVGVGAAKPPTPAEEK